MKRRRISTALAGVAVTCALGAAVWPPAREAGLLVAAQDDPAALSEAQVGSALRNNQKLTSDNIEQALAKGDPALAASFVELARANDIAIPDDLARRVDDAVVEEKSTSHFAKRFATGLVTGNADDAA